MWVGESRARLRVSGLGGRWGGTRRVVCGGWGENVGVGVVEQGAGRGGEEVGWDTWGGVWWRRVG